jgi:hypothetical protein
MLEVEAEAHFIQARLGLVVLVVVETETALVEQPVLERLELQILAAVVVELLEVQTHHSLADRA